MFIVADYSYREKPLYIVMIVKDINKLKFFLKNNKLKFAHIKHLSKKEKKVLIAKWKKFLSNKNNLEKLTRIIEYKFFTDMEETCKFLESLDNV